MPRGREQNGRKRLRYRPEDWLASFRPPGSDLAVSVEAARQRQGVFRAKAGEHHQPDGRTHVGRNFLQNLFTFPIGPGAVWVRRVLLSPQAPDAIGRIIRQIATLGAPSQDNGQDGFDVVSESTPSS